MANKNKNALLFLLGMMTLGVSIIMYHSDTKSQKTPPTHSAPPSNSPSTITQPKQQSPVQHTESKIRVLPTEQNIPLPMPANILPENHACALGFTIYNGEPHTVQLESLHFQWSNLMSAEKILDSAGIALVFRSKFFERISIVRETAFRKIRLHTPLTLAKDEKVGVLIYFCKNPQARPFSQISSNNLISDFLVFRDTFGKPHFISPQGGALIGNSIK